MRSSIFRLAVTVLAVASTACSVSAVAAEAFAVFRSHDRGQSWVRSDTGMPSWSRINAFGSSTGVLFAGTDSGIFTSRDKALSWQPGTGAAQSSGRILSFASLGSKVFAGTAGNGLLVSLDAGSSWAPDRTFPSKKVRCLLAHEGRVYAGTDSDGVFASGAPGQPWTPLAAGLPTHAQIFALSMVKGTLFAGLYRQGLYAWNDQRRAWAQSGPVSPLALASVQDVLIAGHNPGGLHWSGDKGVSWSKGVAEGQEPAPVLPVLSVDSRELSSDAPVWELGGADGLVIAGAADGIFSSEDRGRTWRRARGGLPEKSSGIAFLLERDVVLAGTVIQGSKGAP